MRFAENDLDNRIPAGHAAFFNSFPYTRLGYTSIFGKRQHIGINDEGFHRYPAGGEPVDEG